MGSLSTYSLCRPYTTPITYTMTLTMHSRSALSSYLLSALACAALAAGQKKCYWQDGSEADTYFPCNEEADDSACCFQTDVCLSNGYCLQQSEIWANRLGTPACTDQSWDSDNCPKDCASVAKSSPISLYLDYDTTDGAFCCAENYNPDSKSCPKGPNSPFSLASGIVVANRADGSLILPNPSNPNASSNALGAASGVTTRTQTVTYASQTQTTTISASAANQDDGSGNTLATTAGVAIPLAILLLAALVACGVLWHQVRRLKQKQGAASSSQSMAVHDTGKHPNGIGSSGMGWQQPPQYGELDGGHINEAPTAADPVEVHGERY